MATPQTPDSQTTPEERSEQLRAAIARRQALDLLPPPHDGHPAGCKCAQGEQEQEQRDKASALDTCNVVAASTATSEALDIVSGIAGDAFKGERQLGQDEQNLADGVGNLLEKVDPASARERFEDDEEEEEEEDSAFGAVNTGRERLADIAGGLIPEDGAGAPELDDRRVPGRGNPFVNQEDEDSSVTNLLGGTGREAVQDMLDDRRSGLMEEVGLMTSFLNEAADTTVPKTSFAQGTNANGLTQAELDAAAAKYGVTPPMSAEPAPDGGAVAPPPAPAAEKPWYDKISNAIFGRDLMGNAGSAGTGLQNQSQAGQLAEVDSGLGKVNDKQTAPAQAAQVEGNAPAGSTGVV